MRVTKKAPTETKTMSAEANKAVQSTASSVPKKRKQSPLKVITSYQRRSARSSTDAKLKHNASKASLDAWTSLYQQGAIDKEHLSLKADFHVYPNKMIGRKKYHIRATFNISKDVAKKLLSEKVLSDSYERVQETFHHHYSYHLSSVSW